MSEMSESQQAAINRLKTSVKALIARAVTDGLDDLEACEYVLQAASAARNRIHSEKYLKGTS